MSQAYKIPFIDLFTAEKRDLLSSMQREIERVVSKSQFILGDAVAEFESRFAQLSGTRHSVGVNSGLDALILGLRTLGVGPGDEVITVPNSFIATAAAIALVGARPIFVDVGSDYNLDPDQLESVVTKKTKAVMPVHLTGNPCKMGKISEVAHEHSLKVIEDAAQAVGANLNGKPVGGLGDLGAFSLHPLKNLHVWGDGGMVTTNSDEFSGHLKLERNHGLRNRDEVDFFSYNSRLDTIQAVAGLSHLSLLEQTTNRRISNAKRYHELLSELREWVTLPETSPGARHVFHVYQVRAVDRDRLKQFLAEQGIETKIHYPIPIHWQKACAYLGYRRGDFPMTEKLAAEILSLPVRENLKPDEIESVCEAIKKFYRR
jgi:dTDP-4-amino-4,6-dideoxygalactose transaminase